MHLLDRLRTSKAWKNYVEQQSIRRNSVSGQHMIDLDELVIGLRHDGIF